MVKGIIFDFDGVIVDSVEIKGEAFREIYTTYGKEISDKVIEHHELNGGVSRFDKFRFYHNNFLKKEITENEIQKLSDDFSRIVLNKVIKSPYIGGVLSFIKKNFLEKNLFISTATPSDEIEKILLRRQINDYFTSVYGSPEKKDNHILKIIKKNRFNEDELVFIGDSTSDFEAAKKMNVKFILVKNRFNKDLRNSFSGKVIEDFRNFKIE